MLTAGVLPLFSDDWESDEDDDESEWMDVYHSSDEEEEVQSVYSLFLYNFSSLFGVTPVES